MKGFLVILSCIILVFIVLERSGAFFVGSKMALEGGVKVEKTIWEWHPEKVGPYLKSVSDKWLGPFFKPAPTAPQKKRKIQKATHRLLLKNGTAISGGVVRQDQQGILFRSEEGEIFFHRDEILSVEEK